MTDVFEQDKLRILGPARNRDIQERARLDVEVRAALAIQQEAIAEAQAHEQALAREAALIGEAERAAVERLAALKDLYQARQEAARVAIEALARVARIETDLRAGLSDADRSLQNVEVLIEPTRRGAWRSALRERAGLPLKHGYMPDVKLSDDAQRVGAAAVAGVTSAMIGPGWIQVGRDVVNLE